MKMSFALTEEEVCQAVQVFIAKQQRSRNIKVNSFASDTVAHTAADGSVSSEKLLLVEAEVSVAAPVKRQARAAKDSHAPKKSKKETAHHA